MRLVGLLASLLIAASCTLSPPVADAAPQSADGGAAEDAVQVPAYLEKDLGDLVALMQGRWDNDRHVFFAEEAGLDESELAPRQHLVIAPVEDADTPQLKATRTVEGAAPAVLVHAFRVDGDRHVIVQAMMSVAGAPLGCEIAWTRRGGGFDGTAQGEGCKAVFPRPEATDGPDVTMSLSQDEYWISARAGAQRIEARLRRARPFSCWVAVLRGAEHGDSGEGMRDWYFTRGVMLHDQYGEAIVTTDETPARDVSIRLRNVDWPYGTNRPSLTLYVHKPGDDRAISYAWTSYDADRVGLNLRWLQVSCTHAPDQMFNDF